jgi:RimJ/RimL family protein N-acetyltransferase
MADRFEPIETARLRLRPFVAADAATLATYRSDPDVARYQGWSAPYPLADAEALVADMVALGGITEGEWYQIAVEEGATHDLVGDVAIHLLDEGRQAEIGCTIVPGSQGNGYSVEALGALVDHAFRTVGVHRIFALLDERNVASARLVERLGFRLEGRGRKAVWSDGEWSDDCEYGLLEEEWDGVPLRRPPPRDVALVEVDRHNYDQVCRIEVAPSQERFVSSVRKSIADAAFPYDGDVELRPWYRAIAADGELVGFLMVAEPIEQDPRWFLWRFLIGAGHQRRGIGHRALRLLAERVRDHGGDRLYTSYRLGAGGPEGFYHRHGFEPCGEEGGETVAVAPLAALLQRER